MARPFKKSIPLGVDVDTNDRISLSLARLSEHMDVIGPTGVGKTRGAMLPLFQELAAMPDVSVIAMTCKGNFCTMCSDWAIAHGLSKELIVFKPGQMPL